jgi:hypothetical protein
MLEAKENILALKARTSAPARRHPKGLMEAVYGAGSLAVAADDVPTKTAARMLQALGLLAVQVVLADGSLQAIPNGEARNAMDRPWRLAKPAFTGELGVPDADGAFWRRT